MTKNILRVQVQHDHLYKIANSTPVKSIAELIWNSLDADATLVKVDFERNEFGINKIMIRDNGSGFSRSEAEDLFSSLGGSWKSAQVKTINGRYLHGKEGQGRFKAFNLGGTVTWKVKYYNKDDSQTFALKMHSSDMSHVSLSNNDVNIEDYGVTVEIENLNKDSASTNVARGCPVNC